jgi:CheY-like chemotaxis protein
MPFKMLYNYSMRERPLVLLIDDEEIFLEIASVKLQADGLDTVMTQDFEDAIVKAETLMPDFILSDIFMPPGRSGWELALELRKNPKTRAIKFAFFTSLRDPWLEFKGAERQKMMAALGDVTFFSKADDIEVLGERVAKRIKE